MAEQKENAYGWLGQTSLEDTFRVISFSEEFIHFYVSVDEKILKLNLLRIKQC